MKTKAPFSHLPILKHALATPITNVLQSIELAHDLEKQINSSTQIYLRQALINARYMQHVLQLADQPAELNSFNLAKAIKEVLAMNAQHKNKISLFNKTSSSINIFGNKLIFQEVLIILINNAWESYDQKNKNKFIKIILKKNKKNIVLSCTDGGNGMTWWEKARCFQKNFSTKQNHSGLGLAFAKRKIEQEFRGKIEVISKKNLGTTFFISFPLKVYSKPQASLIGD